MQAHVEARVVGLGPYKPQIVGWFEQFGEPVILWEGTGCASSRQAQAEANLYLIKTVDKAF